MTTDLEKEPTASESKAEIIAPSVETISEKKEVVGEAGLNERAEEIKKTVDDEAARVLTEAKKETVPPVSLKIDSETAEAVFEKGGFGKAMENIENKIPALVQSAKREMDVIISQETALSKEDDIKTQEKKKPNLAEDVVLEKREASKKLLADERAQLAKEIFEERKEEKERIAELKTRLEFLQTNLSTAETNWEANQKEYEKLRELQGEQANSFAGRIKQMANRVTGIEFEKDRLLRENIQEAETTVQATAEEKEELKDEISDLEKLIESETSFSEIKNKIAEHYSKAERVSQEYFEQQQRTVENSVIRNNIFILHALSSDDTKVYHGEIRHNGNSPVSKEATLEDDLDIALSMEPSLSTTSVGPGTPRSLWHEKGGRLGIIIGAGEIESADPGDGATVPTGIGKRAKKTSSLEEIDAVLEDKKGDGGYNEIVVNNPKVFGMFKSINIAGDGSFVIAEDDTIGAFNGHIAMARKKGVPQFVLTPDRRMFEYIAIDESGVITTGKEISPADVAKGKAGLSVEERKKIGEEVLKKYLFMDMERQREAKEIITGLSPEGEKEGTVELSREEYLDNLWKHPEEMASRLFKYPISLRLDKAFMTEAAKINPESAFKCVPSDSALKRDPDFIKSIYSEIIPPPAGSTERRFIARQIPEEAINKEFVLLALAHNEDIDGVLSEEIFNDPEIKQKVIETEADNFCVYASKMYENDKNYRDREHMEKSDHWENPPRFYLRNSSLKENYPFEKNDAFMERVRKNVEGKYKVEVDAEGHIHFSDTT